MNIPDLISEAQYQFFGLKILEFFNAYTDPGSCQPWIRDGRNWVQDGNNWIPDPGLTSLIRKTDYSE
jgi:hypothetical protein